MYVHIDSVFLVLFIVPGKSGLMIIHDLLSYYKAPIQLSTVGSTGKAGNGLETFLNDCKANNRS